MADIGGNQMTKLEDVILEGASGNRYDFTAYTTDTAFADVAAIYIFTRRNLGSDGRYKYTFLYVGQTSSLQDRIPSHEKWPCVRRYGVDSICTHLDPSESSRLAKERDLINWGNSPPPCNDQ